MRTGKPRGLTFLELMLAMMIAFLAVSFLMGLFISGAKAGARSRQVSEANLLAQGAMERLLAVPVDQLPLGTHAFGPAYPGYSYRLEVIDPGDFDGDGNDDPELSVLTMTVITPVTDHLSFSALRRKSEPFMGATGVDASSNKAVFTVMGDNSPISWTCGTSDDDPCACALTLPAMPSGQPGDVCCDGGGTSLWAVDYSSGGIRKLDMGTNVWGPAVIPPLSIEPQGIGTDITGSTIWLTDTANKALWSYTVATGQWQQIPAPADPLLRPLGVAVHKDGKDIWIADKDKHAIRHYNTTTGWDPTLYQHAELQDPEGVAVGLDGTVYAVNPYKVFIFSGGVAGAPAEIDGKAQTDYPAGLSVSWDGKVLYLATRRGSVWAVDLEDDPGCVDWEFLYWVEDTCSGSS